MEIQKEPLNELSKIKHVIAVVSGKGGVGKSTVSALLTVGLNRLGYQVGLMDADITGPSIPRMFGLKGRPKQTDVGMFPLETEKGIRVMSLNLLLDNEDDPVIWRGPLLGGTVRQFWTDVVWHDLDYLILDLPPGTGDVPLTVMQSLPVDGIVLVASPQDLVYMEVKKSLKMARMLDIPLLGLVENMSYLQCPHCGEEITIFGKSKAEEVAADLDLELLTRLPIDPAISQLMDTGGIEGYDQIDLGWAEQVIENIKTYVRAE